MYLFRSTNHSKLQLTTCRSEHPLLIALLLLIQSRLPLLVCVSVPALSCTFLPVYSYIKLIFTDNFLLLVYINVCWYEYWHMFSCGLPEYIVYACVSYAWHNMRIIARRKHLSITQT